MTTPGRFAALKLLSHETNESTRTFGMEVEHESCLEAVTSPLVAWEAVAA